MYETWPLEKKISCFLNAGVLYSQNFSIGEKTSFHIHKDDAVIQSP